ncbi:MAG: hypothetical protein MR867_04710 [Eubacterium sp.]|nr:hypothetical protein [Eubacterium sp.]MDD7208650.1 hypothetical protein [Lachnospiraceae bacterium]MDY5498001.1 hypothetical protein [Anaerobutyricum sp.]
MKKHHIISVAVSVAGLIAAVSLVLYLMRDHLKNCPFFSSLSQEEPEEDIFNPETEDSDNPEEPEIHESEKEEKRPSQAKIRRGYIPLNLHFHDEAEA